MSDRQLFVALGPARYRVERPFYAHAGPGMISDVAVDPDGRVHVLIRRDPLVDPAGPAIVTLDAGGRVLSQWGGDLIDDAHMLSAAPDGRLFIVDRDAHEVGLRAGGRRPGGPGPRPQPPPPVNHPTPLAF